MFTPHLLNKLPLKYRCSANKIKYKPSLFIFNCIEVYFSTYFFDKKPTIICDHHIVGNNPIINLLLIYFIGLEASQKETKTTITVSSSPYNDYWAYSLVEDKLLYETLSTILKEDIESYNEFLKFITRKIPLNKINIFYHKLGPEWSRYDHYIKEFLFSFGDGNNQGEKRGSKDISHHILQENKIRDNLAQLSLAHLQKFEIIQAISNPLPEKGLKVFSPISHITSLPQGWLNIETFQPNKEDKNTILLEHHFSKMQSSYASANRISANLQEMKDLSIQQLLELEHIFQKNISANTSL